jgi:hypothetical protein
MLDAAGIRIRSRLESVERGARRGRVACAFT